MGKKDSSANIHPKNIAKCETGWFQSEPRLHDEHLELDQKPIRLWSGMERKNIDWEDFFGEMDQSSE